MDTVRQNVKINSISHLAVESIRHISFVGFVRSELEGKWQTILESIQYDESLEIIIESFVTGTQFNIDNMIERLRRELMRKIDVHMIKSNNLIKNPNDFSVIAFRMPFSFLVWISY